jgi:hypothetical protein
MYGVRRDDVEFFRRRRHEMARIVVDDLGTAGKEEAAKILLPAAAKHFNANARATERHSYAALDEAAARVSRYLIMQLIVNSTYGLAVAAGLYAIGVPNAILWGLLAGLLRYIPYLGPWISAAFPIALSLAAFDSWREPLLTAGLFVVLELLSNNVMEPLLYSSSTGISTIGILVAAVFWTWLWGSIGLVLATPLTVCIAVLGRYVPELEFFKILLADEEVLPLGAQYYQRLLAGDHEEANELVDKFLEHGSVEDLYETVLLPALQLIEQDSHRGALDLGKQEYIRESMRELIEEMPDRVGTTSVTEVAAKPASPRCSSKPARAPLTAARGRERGRPENRRPSPARRSMSALAGDVLGSTMII